MREADKLRAKQLSIALVHILDAKNLQNSSVQTLDFLQ